MREFVVTSKNFTGAITFGYNENGKLVKFLFEAVMPETYEEWVKTHIPWEADQVMKWKSKTTAVTEVTDISFDRFWDDYGYKKGKEEAVVEWKKLKPSEQVKAIIRIPVYKYDCSSRNVAMLYPCRYLKKKRFNDE